MENETMQIIVFAGNSRSFAIQSIRAAKQGKFEESMEYMEEAEKNLKNAHRFHATILAAFSDETTELPVNLFMVHGEDHLMSAITTIDLAKEFLDVHRNVKELTTKVDQLLKERK